MKVYITMYWGPFTESNILGVFVNEEDAEQLAEKERHKIQKEWVELWSNTEDADMPEDGPNDTTGVVEYEVQYSQPIPLQPTPLSKEEQEEVEEQERIDAELD